jgi:predicted RNase H-like HicB family nuclease
MTRYTATCRRAGDWWAISVLEIKGVHTQARRLDQVDAMVRDAIALMLDVPADSFEVDVTPEVPDEVAEALRAREELRGAEEAASAATERAVHWLIDHGYTVRDAGRLLNLSPQRISQLTNTQRRPAA